MLYGAESLWKKNSVLLRRWLIKKLIGEGLDWNIEASLSLDNVVRYCPKGEVLCSLGPVNRLFPNKGDPVSGRNLTQEPVVIEWEIVPYNFNVLDLDAYINNGIAIEASLA